MNRNNERTVLVVGMALWSVSLTIGALRVILPVYFSSVGLSVPKIALFFVLDTSGQILAPMVIGTVINRFGYRHCMLGGLGIHALISFMYLFDPTLLLIYFERFFRGLITMPLMTEVYVKHFSSKAGQSHHINLVLGLGDVAKGFGMLIGGGLIAVLPFGYSIIVFGLLIAVAGALALTYLPDLREQIKMPILQVWANVDPKIKKLGLSRGFLQGAEDAWASAILPVYLTIAFGLSSTQVGAVMMIGLIFYGSNVSVLSRWILTRWDPRKALVGSGLLLLPVCFSLSLPTSVSIFIFVMCLYQMLNAACAVYQNHLKLEFASKEKTSIDLAVFKTLSNIVKPVAVLIAGVLADRMGFNWVFYFSSLLVLLSALTSLVLSKARRQSSPVVMASFGSEVAALKK